MLPPARLLAWVCKHSSREIERPRHQSLVVTGDRGELRCAAQRDEIAIRLGTAIRRIAPQAAGCNGVQGPRRRTGDALEHRLAMFGSHFLVSPRRCHDRWHWLVRRVFELGQCLQGLPGRVRQPHLLIDDLKAAKRYRDEMGSHTEKSSH